MGDDSNDPATKGFVREVETRLDSKIESVKSELKEDIDKSQAALINHMNDVADQIRRSFEMTTEKIREEMSFRDDQKELKNRVERLETEVFG